MSTFHYIHCPVCGSPDIKDVLSAKDYTVSGETFDIAECGACTARFTQDAPDSNSIAPYYKSENYISHTNTSKGVINRLYQFVRRKTLRQKRKLIKRMTKIESGRLLDVGSGTGAFINEMKINRWQVTGLEPDTDARIVARKLYKIDLDEMPEFYRLAAQSYDAITLWHVLEHVHDLSGYMLQLKNLLKADGRLFIAVPNYTSKDAKIYKEKWAAYDVPRHLYHFSPQAIQVLMEKNGLRIIAYKPMWYDSFYVSMLSSQYKNGKANMLAACFNGLRSNLLAMMNAKKCSSVIYIIGKK